MFKLNQGLTSVTAIAVIFLFSQPTHLMAKVVDLDFQERKIATKPLRLGDIHLSVSRYTKPSSDMNVGSEPGSAELKREGFTFGLGREAFLYGRPFHAQFNLTWGNAELDYENGQGVLNLDSGLSYGLDLDFSLLKTERVEWLAFTSFEKGSLSGDNFTDALNLRASLPFEAEVNITEFKLGVQLERNFNGAFMLGSSLFYSSIKADMSTGWSINTPAQMDSRNSIGGSFYLELQEWEVFEPRLTFGFGNETSIAVTLKIFFLK